MNGFGVKRRIKKTIGQTYRSYFKGPSLRDSKQRDTKVNYTQQRHTTFHPPQSTSEITQS